MNLFNPDFNPTIVRLKLEFDNVDGMLQKIFQSYNSSIKTGQTFDPTDVGEHFNPTIVRLKPLFVVDLISAFFISILQ